MPVEREAVPGDLDELHHVAFFHLVETTAGRLVRQLDEQFQLVVLRRAGEGEVGRTLGI